MIYDDILLLVRLVNAGKFATVAEELKVVPSTIYRRIEALEKELGVKLIIENSKPIELTEAGKVIYNNFKNCEKTIQKLIAPIYEASKKPTGKLRVMLPVFLSHYAITPYLPGFVRRHPELEINITYNSYNINMRKEDYDMVLVAFLPHQSTQKVKLLHTDKIVLVCSREYVEQYGVPNKINELKDHLIIGKILFDQSIINNLELYSEEDDSIIKMTNPEHFRINSFLEVLYLVKHGSAIAGLPEASILKELLSGEMVRVFPNYHCGYIKHYLLRNLDDNDLRYKKFEQFLVKCIAKLNYSVRDESDQMFL